MNAKQRVLKTLDHTEPDRVPSFEGSIDNLRICEYWFDKFTPIFRGPCFLQMFPIENRNVA